MTNKLLELTIQNNLLMRQLAYSNMINSLERSRLRKYVLESINSLPKRSEILKVVSDENKKSLSQMNDLIKEMTILKQEIINA